MARANGLASECTVERKKKKSCYIKVVRDYVRACDVYFRIFKIVNDESRGCCCNFSVNVLMNRFKRKGNGRLYVVTATCGCVLMFGKVNLYFSLLLEKLIEISAFQAQVVCLLSTEIL